jgi:hypothetical protein
MKRDAFAVKHLAAYLAVLLLIVSKSMAADFAEVQPDADRFRRDSVEQKPFLLKDWKKRLARREELLRSGRSGVVVPEIATEVDWPKRGWVKFKSREAKKLWLEKESARLEKTKRTLAEFESGALLPPPYFQAPIQPGQVGVLGPVPISVLQVIDGDNMLAETSLEYRYREGAGETKRMVWIRGISTSGLAAGASVKPDEDTVYRIAGARTYNATTGGLNTVLVVQPLEEDTLRKLAAPAK